MYDLVYDIASYSDFVPWCEEGKVLFVENDIVVASLTFVTAGARYSFTTKNKCSKSSSIGLNLVDNGLFNSLEGCWSFDAIDGERGSQISLDLIFEFNSSIYSAMFSPFFQQLSAKLVSVFVRRADSLYRSSLN